MAEPIRSEVDLHAYQREAVDFALAEPYTALFMRVGAGKSVTSLTVIKNLLDEFMVGKVLVIAPLRVARTVWPTEPLNWSHLSHLRVAQVLGDQKARLKALTSDADIYAINRENVPWLVEHYGDKWPFDMVVIDESRSFSDHKSKRFKAMKAVLKHIRRIILLTGTPRPQGVHDLWAQIYMLDRGARLGHTISAFRARWMDANPYTYQYTPKPHAEAQIEGLISDLAMVVESYAGMPAVTRNVIACPLPPEAFAAYEEFEKERVMELPEGELTPANAAVLANKLLQFSNGAMYDDDRKVHELHTAKLDALGELIESLDGDPLLVAYSFKHDVDRILKRFPKAKVLDKSQKMVDDWNAGKIPVLLGHPAGMSHGLNLQHGGANMCWFGLTWSLELFEQMNGRLARQGQARPVVEHYLVAPGTLDSRLLGVLQSKAVGQNKFLSAVKSLVAARRNSTKS